MKNTSPDSLRIRLIAAVQESDQDQDQDSESLARRSISEVQTVKKKMDIQLGDLKDPMRFGKKVNDGIKCKLCQAVLGIWKGADGRINNNFKRHLGKGSYLILFPLTEIDVYFMSRKRSHAKD